MNWRNIYALISLALGFVTGIARLNSMRSRTHSQAEIAWQQPPLSAWRYETRSMLTITIHSLGLIGLAACLLLDLTRNRVLTFPPKSELFILAMVAIFFTAYESGGAIAYHVGQLWIRPVSYGICSDGVLYGGYLLSWKSYSHYEIGPEDGQISLYSSYSPALRTWVLQPPPESLSDVLGFIPQKLPAAPVMDDSAPLHSPLMLLLGMTALVLGTLLPAIWGLMQGISWVWIYALVAFLLVSFLGNRLITIFDGRGKYPKQDVQTT